MLHGVRESSGEGAKFQHMVGDLRQQLGQQHQDVREWRGALGDKGLADVIDADDGVTGQARFRCGHVDGDEKRRLRYTPVRMRPAPMEVLEDPLPVRGQADAGGMGQATRRVARGRLQGGKGAFKKKKRLFLVCAHTHRLVPCGPSGQGHDIEQPRTGFRMSISVATFALQVLCSTLSAMAVAPLSGAGAAVEATVSVAVGNFESMLHDQLAGLALDDHAAALGVVPQITQLEGRVYASLREFVRGVEGTTHLESFKAKEEGPKRTACPS